MKLHKIAFVLLVIGGLNWLLTAFGYGIQNYVSAGVAQVIFILVGIAALLEIFGHKKTCKECM
jgi:uncharacterized membrane protein YuzA (DUF378 family)